MVLAAGRGSRLVPLTDEIPKCLVEADGKTMLERTLCVLLSAGVTEAVVNTCYKAEMVEEFLNNFSLPGLTITISREDELLETGGSILHARKQLEGCDAFVVHNADVFSEFPLQRLIEAHLSSDSIASLCVSDRKTKRYLLFDEDFSLLGWRNLDPKREVLVRAQSGESRQFAFNGISIHSPDFFRYLERDEKKFSIVTAWLEAVEAGEKISGIQMDGHYWIDIGTVEKLEQLQKHLRDQSGQR